MPLIVYCPNGCVIRVPLARAGTIVRCSECKSVIQLRRLTPEESTGRQTIEVRAFRAIVGSSGREVRPDPESPMEAHPVRGTDADDHFPEGILPAKVGGANIPRDSAAGSDLPYGRTDPDSPQPTPDDPFDLPVPQPARLRFAPGRRAKSRARRPPLSSAHGVDGKSIDLGLARPNAETDFESINLVGDAFDYRFDEEYRFLSQFFAACIGVLGLILIVPSLLAWSGWSALPVEPMGSRWIFIMIFLGALHIVYAIFLFQIQERAALWSVSIFLLCVGCVHGVFTAGTWLDQGLGPVSRFLQLPPTETAAVTLWCFLHLCFSVLLSYLCGRQALRWKLRLERNVVSMP